jgi:hypothetical protein
MICDDNSCGTGSGNIPKPGDPSNNGVLSATPAFGGIDINWTFPTTNPFAVAYTTIYRALSANFNGAILLAPQVGGGFYYDPVDPGIEYFYWITFVSINGTVGEVIGPVSAVARSSIEKTIEDLTGKIDSGVLAQSLKTEIARIPAIDEKIFQETQERIDTQWTLAEQILQQQEISDETVTKVVDETTQRQTADSAVVTSINQLYAQAGGNAAAISQEAIVRANKDEALATLITNLSVQNGDTLAALREEERVRATADEALSQRIITLAVTTGTNTAAIRTEETARATADEALSTRITSVLAKTDTNSAAILSEQTARTTADSALGVRIDTVSATTGSNAVAIQTEITARTTADTALGTRIDTVQTKTDQNGAAITSEITARTTADTALGSRIDITNTKVGQNTAAVLDETTARVTGDAALATRITQTETSLNGNLAQAQTQLQTKIDTVNGKVTAIGALYTAKVTVNGLIGGFGIYNDGTEVEAGFDVDTFWVGRTGANKRKPFIIVGGETFIDQAVINQLTFDKLRAADGSVIVENGKLKAAYIDADNITARKIDVTGTNNEGARTTIVGGLTQVFYPNGNICLKIGVW